MPKRKPSHGGKREGAGRKPLHGEAKKSLTITITPEVRAFLDSLDQSCSESVEAIIRQSKQFKQWQKS